MERWQQDLLLKEAKIDFLNDIEQIKEIIKQLLEPLEEESIKTEIKRDDGDVYLANIIAGDEKYSIIINHNTIRARHRSKGKSNIPCAKYNVNYINSKKAYEHAYILEEPYDVSTLYKPLESTNFDYKGIINKLMNYIVSDIK